MVKLKIRKLKLIRYMNNKGSLNEYLVASLIEKQRLVTRLNKFLAYDIQGSYEAPLDFGPHTRVTLAIYSAFSILDRKYNFTKIT